MLVLYLIVGILMTRGFECNVSLELQATIGQALEFRCDSNETSKFNRITHIADSGAKEVLLSNDHVNPSFDRNEVTIRKVDHTFLITISPVKLHSAGLYVCDDDTSSSSGSKSHINTIRVHVLQPVKAGQIKSSSNRVEMKERMILLLVPVMLMKLVNIY